MTFLVAPAGDESVAAMTRSFASSSVSGDANLDIGDANSTKRYPVPLRITLMKELFLL